MDTSKVAVLPGASRSLVSPSAHLLDFKTRNTLTQVKLPLTDPIDPFGVRAPLTVITSCIPSPNTLLGA